ncbi:BA14K family protein [Bartonella senegalensis]|uniref:BA14K family protein n=1 Tax=Bartonella senegalensis TaxID=1468418 RepID=UPI0002FF4233|nr:BA14K family protein [Bartonella senegalensis]
MLMMKSFYYALIIAIIGSVFIIVTNIIGSVQKSYPEMRVSYPASIQENTVPLIVTGRRELNGFKGYRHYRRGYRKYSDDWWYPEMAFVAFPNQNAKHVPLKARSTSHRMLLISSLEEKEPWMLKQHLDSCHARYRSYNESDNSYQPFYGPRKQCFSRFFKG